MTPAQELTQRLNGRWHGRYGTACCPRHEDKSPSLQISDSTGIRSGVLVHCHAGCDWRDVKAAARAKGLLIDRGEPALVDPETQQKMRAERDREKRRQRDYATRVWNQCQPAAGTLVETYLRSRSLDIKTMPDVIRFHGAMKHVPTGLFFPTMVAGVSDERDYLCGLHRTYLLPTGTGKARVTKNKMMLAECAGGAVRLFPMAEKLGIAEGIETALSAAQMFGLPTWATLSTSGMKGVALPPEVCDVVIFADHDEIDPRTGKRPGTEAAEQLAVRLRAERRRVRIHYPQAGFNDFNDQLRQARAA